MARIQTSAIISNISGKVNGSVFQRNQGGLVLRNQSGKINSNTARSNSHRVGISSIQGDWQSLTDTQRLLWGTYALFLNKKQKRNPTLNINGHQLFLNINSIRYDMQNVSALFVPYLLSTPILTPLPQPVNIVTMEINSGNLIAFLDRAMVATEDVVLMYLSRPLTGSRQSANQKTTLMKVATVNGTIIDVTSYYTSVYGRRADVGEWLQTKIAVYNINQENYSPFSIQRLQIQ